MTRPIEVRVYNQTNSSHLGTLSTDQAREWLDDLSAEGSYGFEIKRGGSDHALLQDDRVLRFYIDGTARWAALVEDREPVVADPGRNPRHIVKCSGRGLLALLEKAVVYPELGLGRISPDVRFFNFASIDFTPVGWTTATAFKEQWETDTNFNFVPATAWYFPASHWPAPLNWPAKLYEAKWIGPVDGAYPPLLGGDPVPVGDCYFRKTWTIPVDGGGTRRFYFSADDGIEVYVDGNRVFTETRAFLWGETKYFDLDLDEGEHLIGVKLTNLDRNPDTNVMGFLMAVVKMDAGGASVGDIELLTDDTWAMLAFPTAAPGMTPGQILHVLLTEAQARGYLAGFTWDFDAAEDSNGTSWPVLTDIALNVNMSLLEVVRHLVDEHACDVAMAPTGGLVLHAYVQRGEDLSDDIEIEYGVNISRLALRQSKPGPNVALSRTAEGRWVETINTAAVTAHGRFEIGLSLGSAPSDDAASRQASAFFEDHSEPLEAITDLQVEAINAVPYEDYSVGDWVAAPTGDGDTERYRVKALRVTHTREGEPVYAPELVKEAA